MTVDQSNESDRYQVIVAGGGSVGMTMTVELAHRGIKTLMCEQNDEGVYHTAKTNFSNARTMEHFRRLGIADRLRANDPVPTKYHRDVTFSTRANGQVLLNMEGACEWKERLPISAEVPEWAPNQAIEKTLHERINEMGSATALFNSEVLDFTQNADQVSVTYKGPDGPVKVYADYLVVCDGAQSKLRPKLNAPLYGETLAQNMSWHFRAPELTLLFEKTRLSSLTFFLNEDGYADIITPQSGDDHWLYLSSPIPEGVDPLSYEDFTRMLYSSIGTEFEIFEAKGRIWSSHSRMLPTYNFGRVLLAGDAAHLTSPFGGFGMNMGIGDAADLGWKIAAMLHGWGGPLLLSTYSLERRDAERFIIDGSAYNQKLLGAELIKPYMEEDSERGEAAREEVRALLIAEKLQEFQSLGAQLGYHYYSSPIIVRDTRDAPKMDYAEYTPSAVPGCRAPHIWMDDGSSLFDHFGDGFCLLKLDPLASTGALERAARKYNVPFKILKLDSLEASELYDRKLILIRPDQHVAWRGDDLPHDCDRLINAVRGALTYT
jgi:2-polyprenyl-6-methoxyphenol hydroxylase-like FAD-dependent oxidoreductase